VKTRAVIFKGEIVAHISPSVLIDPRMGYLDWTWLDDRIRHYAAAVPEDLDAAMPFGRMVCDYHSAELEVWKVVELIGDPREGFAQRSLFVPCEGLSAGRGTRVAHAIDTLLGDGEAVRILDIHQREYLRGYSRYLKEKETTS